MTPKKKKTAIIIITIVAALVIIYIICALTGNENSYFNNPLCLRSPSIIPATVPRSSGGIRRNNLISCCSELKK